jgi:hypothetical protein
MSSIYHSEMQLFHSIKKKKKKRQGAFIEVKKKKKAMNTCNQIF